MGNTYRRPRTTQERRETGNRCQFIWFDEYRVNCRPGRSMSRLPESRDDIMRWDAFNKSWKRHRKTQYWRLG